MPVRAAEAFLRARGHERVRVAFSPGRINLIGEHTDYNGGYVLPAAIHLGVTACVAEIPDRVLIMHSLQVPGESVSITLGDLRPGACTGWSSYVAGAVWALTEHRPADCGLEIVVDGNVPLGAGLSSSAALECAVIVAVSSLLGIELPLRELARRAQRAENIFAGVPTGSMDQVASMMSEEGCALFYDVRDERITPVPLRLAEHGLSLVVIDTHAAHALVDGGYAERRTTCERAAAILGVALLRELTDLDAAIAALESEDDARRLIARTRHVVTENARVLDAIDALQNEDFTRMGGLMSLSHASLRDDYEVSCLELDVAVIAAMEAGALGARMMGGGFGGSAIALIETARVPNLRTGVEAAYRERGLSPASIHEVEPGPGARVM